MAMLAHDREASEGGPNGGMSSSAGSRACVLSQSFPTDW